MSCGRELYEDILTKLVTSLICKTPAKRSAMLQNVTQMFTESPR